ncbi:extracellular solute-binding protein [Arenibaculum pallidiluteum]|uniref:extracellular solute-binding protein n=1 Tax=Arenibaculum pallidiluteum TaxID=2812559 RepID=UPI001A9669A4|nr:extracellular solute-binding protein [Arenibaculum pallidiluteum]
MRSRLRSVLAAMAMGLACAAHAVPGHAAGAVENAAGLALHGEPKYKPGFAHFDYVNPQAPKGGEIKLAAMGGFDNLHPFILRGIAPAGIGLVFETLMTQNADEPFSMYGSVAESISVPADRSSTTFALRPEARWHDGRPITAEDVIWTFETLMREGSPIYRTYYGDVVRAEKVGDRQVRFTFKSGGNAELPLILGQLPVLPKHWWEGRDFGATTLEPTLGSGPYRVAQVEPGRAITYERVADWWGKDLPINRGRWNFDRIRYDYYRDRGVLLEAFKAGAYDFRLESTAKDWATGYDIPAVRDGRIVREEIRTEDPRGMQGFVLNTRRPLFQDRRVRAALGELFDFEWLNKNIFYDQYKRTRSYFSNSELASSGLPSPAELKILEPYRGKVPDEVFTTEYKPSETDGSGNIRANLRTALDLFKEAGWTLRNGALLNAAGQQMQFEILLDDPALERIVQPWMRNLERAGIKPVLRIVDTAQYKNRTDAYDFDVTTEVIGQSLSPGNEQRDLWSSAAADVPGGQNLAGIRDPAIDDLIERLIRAESREDLVNHTRALDRLLLWGHYVIPQYHSDKNNVAYWNRFGHPAQPPRYGIGFPDTWWIDPAKDARLASLDRGGR